MFSSLLWNSPEGDCPGVVYKACSHYSKPTWAVSWFDFGSSRGSKTSCKKELQCKIKNYLRDGGSTVLYAVDIVHISKALGKSSLGFTFYTLPVLCWCFKDPFTLHRSDLFMKYPLFCGPFSVWRWQRLIFWWPLKAVSLEYCCGGHYKEQHDDWNTSCLQLGILTNTLLILLSSMLKWNLPILIYPLGSIYSNICSTLRHCSPKVSWDNSLTNGFQTMWSPSSQTYHGQ